MAFRISFGEYEVICAASMTLPTLYTLYRQEAKLVDEVDFHHRGQYHCAIIRQNFQTLLAFAQRFEHDNDIFNPGFLFVPEHSLLFIGAGERIAAYDLQIPKNLWVEETGVGFWGWERHGNIILMLAELEFAAWNIKGEKLWAMFVEPPWTYKVTENKVYLDVMGKKSTFDLDTGLQEKQSQLE